MPTRSSTFMASETLMQHNKPELFSTVLLPPPEQHRAPVVKDPSIGVHHKQHLAAPTQGSKLFIGSGEFQNLLVDTAYRESFMFTRSYGQKCQRIKIVVKYNKIDKVASGTGKIKRIFFFFCIQPSYFQVLSIYTAIAICIHSHFTAIENNEKKSQFLKLSLTLPYSGAKAATGIQAMELHECKRSISKDIIQCI